MLKKYSDVAILAILWIISTISLISALAHSANVSIQTVVGYVLLISITICYFFKVKHSKLFLGIILLMSSLNIIRFTIPIISFSYVWKPMNTEYLSISFEPLCFILLCLLIFSNFSRFVELLKRLMAVNSDSTTSPSRHNKYYGSLNEESNEALTKIISNPKTYQPSYVDAAKTLLKEREVVE